MNKRVLVTGGAGFIGSHTVDSLVEKGYRVKILDNLSKPVHQIGKPTYLNKEAEFIHGDVRNKSAWERALKKIDVVFHFAAYQDYHTNFGKYFDVNAKGTALMYETIVEKNLPIEKVVVASSQAIYGEGKYRCPKKHTIFPSQRPIALLKKHQWNFVCPHDSYPLTPVAITEEDFVDPHNQYGISKYSQEKITIHLGRRYKIPSVALRYSIVQGPRQSPYNLYSGALRVFVVHLLANKSPPIFEDGEQLRDYVNVYDVVNANLLVMQNTKANYSVFNVGGGKKWTVLQLFNLVQKRLQTNVKAEILGRFRVGDTRHIFSDINKIQALGFRLRHSIDDSIKSYCQWLETLPNFKSIIRSANK